MSKPNPVFMILNGSTTVKTEAFDDDHFEEGYDSKYSLIKQLWLQWEAPSAPNF